MSRIVVLGDLHFGVRRSSKVFHEILLKELNWVLSIIKKTDSVVFLGDIFDSRSSVDFKILNDAINFFITLSRSCKEVYILAGNHDEYYNEFSRENTNCLFLEFEPGSDSKISPVKVITELSEIKINNKSCLFIPWIDSEDKRNAAKKSLGGKFDIIFGHFNATGLYSVEDHLSDPMAIDDSELPSDTLIISGHYHSRLQKGKVNYIGAFISTSFNEINELKGLYIIDKSKKIEFKANSCPQFHYITIDNPINFIKAFQATDDISQELRKKIEQQVSGNFIKIFLNEYKKENDVVFKIIKSMKPLDLSVEFNKPELSSDLEHLDFEGFDNKTDIAVVLSQYIDTIKDKIPDDINLESVKMLIHKKNAEFKQTQII